MELLHAFFQKIPMAALFLSVAIGYWIGKFKIGNFSLVMVFYGRVVLKMNPVILCGAISGNLTTTAALYAASDAAESSTPVLGYTVSYAVSNVLLTFLGPVIVFTV